MPKDIPSFCDRIAINKIDYIHSTRTITFLLGRAGFTGRNLLTF